jgi:hypothetical protein
MVKLIKKIKQSPANAVKIGIEEANKEIGFKKPNPSKKK